VTDAELATPTTLDVAPRPLAAPELLDGLESRCELPSVEDLVGSLDPPAPLRKAQ
jgi:hypothetical protein